MVYRKLTNVEKSARKLKRNIDKHFQEKNKFLKKDSLHFARQLNQEARKIAKLEKRKVSEVQRELYEHFQSIY